MAAIAFGVLALLGAWPAAIVIAVIYLGMIAVRLAVAPGRVRLGLLAAGMLAIAVVALGAVIVAGLVALVMIFPFVYVVAVSFSSAQDVLGGGLILWPKNPSLEAYRAIFRGGVVTRALTVSAGLVILGTAAKMIATVALAYGLSKRGVPGSKIVLFLVLGTLLFRPGLIPSYLMVKGLGLIDTYQSLILPGLISAFNLIILRSFFTRSQV